MCDILCLPCFLHQAHNRFSRSQPLSLAFSQQDPKQWRPLSLAVIFFILLKIILFIYIYIYVYSLNIIYVFIYSEIFLIFHSGWGSLITRLSKLIPSVPFFLIMGAWSSPSPPPTQPQPRHVWLTQTALTPPLWSCQPPVCLLSFPQATFRLSQPLSIL